MKKIYEKPFLEKVDVIERFGVLFGDSGEYNPEEAMGKQNDMWEESSDPIFESNKKNLWDE